VQTVEVDARWSPRVLDAQSEAVAAMDDEQRERSRLQDGRIRTVGVNLCRLRRSAGGEQARRW
jgi:hypothetical protein